MSDDRKNDFEVVRMGTDLVKDRIMQEIKRIGDNDFVDFSVVWVKSEGSSEFRKIVSVEITKGGFDNDEEV